MAPTAEEPRCGSLTSESETLLSWGLTSAGERRRKQTGIETRMRAYFFLKCVLFFLFAKAHAIAPLRVCTTEEMAFDMLLDEKNAKSTDVTSDQQLHGYDVDMRHELLTKALNLSYTLRVLPSYGELQVETRKDMCDIGWAAFFVKGSRERCVLNSGNCRSLDALETELQSFASGTIDWTPWRCCIDYMPAHINYGMAIVFNSRSISFYEALFGACSQAFFINFSCFTFLLVIIFAHVVYFAERDTNPQFPKNYLDGIDDAMWWSIVSVTTVGYGDIVPMTGVGRIVAVLWMLVGIVMFSILAGIMSSNFSNIRNSVVSYKSVGHLVAANVRVCSYASEFLSGGLLAQIPKVNQVPGSSMAACGEFMKQGITDVTVMDAPIAKYWRSVTPWAAGLSISDDINTYAIALMFPENGGVAGSYYMDLLKPAIMEFTGSTTAKDLASKWFPQGVDSGGANGDEHIKWDLVGPAIGLVACYVLVMIWKMTHKSSFDRLSNVMVTQADLVAFKANVLATSADEVANKVVANVGGVASEVSKRTSDIAPVLKRAPTFLSRSGEKKFDVNASQRSNDTREHDEDSNSSSLHEAAHGVEAETVRVEIVKK